MNRIGNALLSTLLACTTAAGEEEGLTVPEARILAQTQGDLRLGDVTSLTPAVAAALAQHRGSIVSGTSANTLFLDGLREVSDDVADKLLQHEGPLSMTGLTTLSHAGLAKKLVACNGLAMGTTSLSAEAETAIAEALVAHSTNAAVWPSDSLSPQTAAVLATAPRDLYLHEVTRLTADVAGVLAKHRPAVRPDDVLGMVPELAMGLEEILPEIAEALSAHQGSLSLPELQEITPRAAGALAKHGGSSLSLGLKDLSPEVAEALSAYQGSLALLGLMEVAPRTAAALAKHRGPALWLGLVELSPEVAEALSSYEGDLRLSQLKAMSAEVAKKLAPHKGTLDVSGFDIPVRVTGFFGDRTTLLEDRDLSKALDAHVGPVVVNFCPFTKADSTPLYLAGYDRGMSQAMSWGAKRIARLSDKFVREHARKAFDEEAAEKNPSGFFNGPSDAPPRSSETEDWELFWMGYQAAIKDAVAGKDARPRNEFLDAPPPDVPPGVIPPRRPRRSSTLGEDR
jgi:hypothetical protein